MKWKWLLLILVVMIIFTNLPILNNNFLLMFDGKDHFKYANADASFTRVDDLGFKSGAFTPTSICRFVEKEGPEPENQEVFRLYRFNPLCFWRWSYYISTSSKFEYRSWKKIESKRVPYIPDNRWQHF